MVIFLVTLVRSLPLCGLFLIPINRENFCIKMELHFAGLHLMREGFEVLGKIIKVQIRKYSAIALRITSSNLRQNQAALAY